MNFFETISGLNFATDLAVVPVFVNTGAALLPALIAGLASFVTILFRPRELIRVCREKPLRPLGVVVGALAIWVTVMWLGRATPEEETDELSAQGGGMAAAAMMTPDEWVRLARRVDAAKSTAPDDALPDDSVPTVDGRALYLGGGSSRSGYLGGPSPTNLKQRWAFPEEFAMFWSTPLVRGDRVYTAWCTLDPPESFGAVICVDARTGEPVWELDMKDASHEFGGFFSSPALTADGKFLVIGQGLHPDYDSELVCIDTGTGRVKWLVDCPLHIESSPAIAGDIVVVGAGAVENPQTHLPKEHSDPGKDKNPGYVFAVRISTGEIIWKHPVNDPESSPAIADGVAYIGSGFNGNAVVALRLEETDEELKAAGLSREIWKTTTPYPATGAVTLTDDLVLVGCGNGDYVFQAPDPAGAVVALDKMTGEVKWTHPMSDGVLGPIAVRDQTAMVPVRNGEVVAMNIAANDESSRVLWKSVPRKGARVLSGAAVTDTHVYLVTHDGFLVVLDGKSGEVLESLYINTDPGEMGMSIASPIISGGRVYVGSETGGLRCYENGK